MRILRRTALSPAVLSCLLATSFLSSCAIRLPEQKEPVVAGPRQELTLLAFETTDDWRAATQGIQVKAVEGVKGGAIGFDYELGEGRDYAVLFKDTTLSLPENFVLRVHVKGSGPPNNLEFKLIDEQANVYWRKWEDFEFPAEWTRLEIKKADIAFGWGPDPSAPLRDVRRIEFGVSRTSGGNGEVCLDELTMMELPPEETRSVRKTAVSSSSESADFSAALAIDGNRETRWSSAFSDPQWIEVDLGEEKDLIGVLLHWEAAYASSYEVSLSSDRANWTPVFGTEAGNGGIDSIDFRTTRARYVRMEGHRRATSYGYSLYEVDVKTPADPWGEGEPADLFLPWVFEFRTDPGNALTPELASSDSFTEGWTEIRAHAPWEEQGYPGYDGAAWYRTFLYIPAAWSNAEPYIRLTDIRDRFELYINGRLVKADDGARKRCEIALGDHIACDARNALSLKVTNVSADGGILGSVLVARSRQAVADGLLTLLRKNAKDYYRFLNQMEPEGYFPYWLSGKQGYWTVVGTDGDFKESLLCQDGSLEPYKSFSIIPYLHWNGQLVTREDVVLSQHLEEDYLPIPQVVWRHPSLTMSVRAFAAGEPGASTTYARYRVENTSPERLTGKLFVTMQPFEVNPPWQWGGFTKIGKVEYDGTRVRVNEYQIVPLTPPAAFGVSSERQGGILGAIEKGSVPQRTSIIDPDGLASAAIEFTYDLGPGDETDFFIAVPLHAESSVRAEGQPVDDMQATMQSLFSECAEFWEARLSAPRFMIPDADIAQTLKANLAYILVNRDGPAIQPGSRGYEAAWIRDGSRTCVALLKMGYADEVRQYLDWYSKFVYEDGRVPAIVIIGRNEINPIKEYDSQGQLIYLFLQYYLFTKDKDFLSAQWSTVVKCLKYLEDLRNQELQESSAQGHPASVDLGILPRSVSHEGYYPEPGQHSYWDNFWALKGWKDARTIAHVLGKHEVIEWIDREEGELREAVYASIARAMEHHNIDFIPGCRELGDHDPTSTAIAIVACDELAHLPQPALQNTFDRYFENLTHRFDAGWQGSFTPYEIRIAQAFLYMRQKERALRLIDYLMTCRRPSGWRHWAEAVYFPPDQGSFIGDMPHTWVSAGFLNTVRAMFLYEREDDDTLVLAAGIPEAWLEGGDEIGVAAAPTYWGSVTYAMRKTDRTLEVRISGEACPPGGFVLENPIGLTLRSVSLNGEDVPVLPSGGVAVRTLPADINMAY